MFAENLPDIGAVSEREAPAVNVDAMLVQDLFVLDRNCVSGDCAPLDPDNRSWRNAALRFRRYRRYRRVPGTGGHCGGG